MTHLLPFHFETQDLIDAYILLSVKKRVPSSRILKYLVIATVILFLALAGMYFIFNLSEYFFSGTFSRVSVNYFLENLAELLPLIAIYIIPVFLFIISDPLLRFRYSRVVKKNPDILLEERSYSFDNQGIKLMTSLSEANLQWEYFNYALEGKKHFILVKTEDNYCIFPRRIFPNMTDENKFREIVANNIGFKKKTA